MESIDMFMAESEMQEKLTDAYHECWWRLIDAISTLAIDELNQLSNPFLIKCLPEYRKAERKVLFVGQETNGWESFETSLSKLNFGDREAQRDRIIEYLQWMYEDFRVTRKWDYTPYWRGVRRLYQAISPNQGDDGFLHTQLVRFDLNNTRPPLHVEELLQKEYNVLPIEINALTPEVVVFLTGPDYDERIIKTFRNVGGDKLVFEQIEGMKHNGLVRLAHASLPYHTYRTYHPGYSLRNDECVFKPIEEKIIELLKIIPIK